MTLASPTLGKRRDSINSYKLADQQAANDALSKLHGLARAYQLRSTGFGCLPPCVALSREPMTRSGAGSEVLVSASQLSIRFIFYLVNRNCDCYRSFSSGVDGSLEKRSLTSFSRASNSGSFRPFFLASDLFSICGVSSSAIISAKKFKFIPLVIDGNRPPLDGSPEEK